MREVDHRSTSSWRALEAPSLHPTTRYAAPHRHRKTEFSRRPTLRRAGIALTLIIGGLAGTAAYATANLTPLPAWLTKDRLADLVGFGINQVSVTGHKFTPDSELFDALDLANVRTLASFDSSAIRARFERLPWIETAEISRVWPGELAIRVSERAPFAVWSRIGGAFLIDRSGRVLSAVSAGSALSLPEVSGEGANTETAALLSALDRFPALRQRLVTAERVGERRWALHLKNNVVVHLPAAAETTALAQLAADQRLKSTLNTANRSIDLRASQRIAVRALAPSKSGSSLDLSSLGVGD